jgi:hypothetical protein
MEVRSRGYKRAIPHASPVFLGEGLAPVIVYEAHAAPLHPSEPKQGCFRNGISVIFELQNLKMLGLALLWEVCAVIFHVSCVGFTWHRGVVQFGMSGTPPLHDVLHEWLPNMQFARVVPELGMFGSVFYLVSLMLYNFDERSLDCFRSILWSHGAGLITRGLSFSSTLLPDSSQQCHTSQFLGACHDLVFSGHVLMLVLVAAMTQHFYYLHPAVRVTITLNAIFQVRTTRGANSNKYGPLVIATPPAQCVMIAATRNHYTVDVIVAAAISLGYYVAITRHPALVALAVRHPFKVCINVCIALMCTLLHYIARANSTPLVAGTGQTFYDRVRTRP